MLMEVECIQHRIHLPTKDIDTNGLIPTSSVVTTLLKRLATGKAVEEAGYFIGVTKLKTISKGKTYDSTGLKGYTEFLITYDCRTLLPMKGEVMIGIVYKVTRWGVFLRSGPMELVYLSTQKMPNYHFVDEGKFFLSNDMSRIDEGVVIRFMVYATRWWEKTRDFCVLASIEGDSFGPVATAGLDGFDL